MPSPDTLRQLLVAYEACESKKGEDTRILSLDPADSGLADFFLITSATNDRQVVAIADEIEFRLKQDFGLYATSVEGRRQGEWILLDYTDIVIHVFLAEKRAFYDIERLRKSARNLTGSDVEAELKLALAEKTRAVRSTTKPKAVTKKAVKSQTKSKPAKGESTVPAKPAKKAVKKTAKKAAPAAAPKAAKKTAAKTTKAAPVKAAKKVAPRKAVAAKPAPKKATPKVAAVKKVAVKKAAPKKAAPKKTAAKKATVVTPTAAPLKAPAPSAQKVVAPVTPDASAAPTPAMLSGRGAKPPIIKSQPIRQEAAVPIAAEATTPTKK